MAVNVWEWVNVWYDRGYYVKSPVENPAGPESGSSKVLRGGGWDDRSLYVRSAYRGDSLPDVSYDGFGFRCVLPGG